jgi:hypothetical protein
MLPPVLGSLTKHPAIDEWLQSDWVTLDSLGGHRFRFIFDASALVEGDDAIASALENTLRPGLNLLAHAESHVFRYFQDSMRLRAEEAPDLAVASAPEVWRHVDFGESIHVQRKRGDRFVPAGVYLSVECGCAWEVEHGLQLVFRDGVEVVKVGPYDGHLTNAHAFADPRLIDVIYRSTE